MISLEAVSKSYPGKQRDTVALDCIDLKIEENEFVILRGPSGSGKTTLLFLMAGMMRPSRGEIRVAGQELSKMSAESKAGFRIRNIGFIFQMFHLIPYLNVLDNIVLAAGGGETDRPAAESLLGRLGMGEKARSLPAELSAGEKQRTAVGRALINRPQIVLADEPTGNLDPENTRIVLSHLSDFHKKGGTVVLASHSDLAEQVAGRVVRLEEGRLVNLGGRL